MKILNTCCDNIGDKLFNRKHQIYLSICLLTRILMGPSLLRCSIESSTHLRRIPCRRESSLLPNEKITLNANLYKNAITMKSPRACMQKETCIVSSPRIKGKGSLYSRTIRVSFRITCLLPCPLCRILNLEIFGIYRMRFCNDDMLLFSYIHLFLCFYAPDFKGFRFVLCVGENASQYFACAWTGQM